jgi:predicted nuclease of predicted toxin-antitoxin system
MPRTKKSSRPPKPPGSWSSPNADFRHLLDRFGPPPQVLWLTCGNTSNERLQEVLRATIPAALELLAAGEPLIEIGNVLP